MEKLHDVFHQAEHHLGSILPKSNNQPSMQVDYGQDVPVFTLLIFLIGFVFIGLTVIVFKGMLISQPVLGTILLILFGSIGLL
ncbi:hypothetical protein EG832_12110, partial [bacterium]|nr:hypothetical protein [bacterium]